jgi:hypothetical protein
MKIILSILLLSFIVSQAAGQQAHASLSEQKMCADQAKKFFKDTDFADDSKHPLKNEFTSHYDASRKICYVRIDYSMKTGGKSEVSISSYVFDAFEGRNVAAYTWISETGKKYWEVKPVECSIKPVGEPKRYCTTTEEFEAEVDKLFGLGE